MKETTQTLLREAVEWRLLGLLFEYPNGDWSAQVKALSREVLDPELMEAATLGSVQASEGIHCSLFGPGGPVAVRAASYQSGVQLGYLLAELSSLYQSFCYRPATHESPDHLAVQIGFVAYLKLKEAFAIQNDSGAEAAICAEAVRYIMKEHLSLMAQPVAEALDATGPPFLVLAAHFLLQRVGEPPRQPTFAVPGAAAADDDVLQCGLSGDAAEPLIQLTTQEIPHGYT
jgi:nitrate reductase assembly molybdenum cofactor insertion protein NarJ